MILHTKMHIMTLTFPIFLSKQLRFITSPFLDAIFLSLGFFPIFSNLPFLRWEKNWPTNIHTGETTESQGVKYNDLNEGHPKMWNSHPNPLTSWMDL